MNESYILFIFPVIIFAYWAQFNVHSVYKKYSNFETSARITGYDMARKILDANGLYDVNIGRIAGELSSCYVVKKREILLSNDVYDGTSAAAVGVAAHEAGHAVQYAKNYIPVKLKNFIWPACALCSKLALPLLFIGFIIEFYSLAALGLLFFGFATLLELLNLPIEFNASKRALALIREKGDFSDVEVLASKKVLNAAALTYIAAFAVSLMQFIRFVAILRKRN